MALRLGRWFLVLALVLTTGGHWAFLQSVAWIGMTVQFSQTEPLDVALEKTFNGQNPCKLCKAVAEGKKSEQRRSLLKLETKLDLLCGRAVAWLTPPPPFSSPAAFVQPLLPRLETPPVPPPRVA